MTTFLLVVAYLILWFGCLLGHLSRIRKAVDDAGRLGVPERPVALVRSRLDSRRLRLDRYDRRA